ncbi:MAG: hypothetical protein GX640_07175 [Fibrobacter sp.]|nr:hypothetical protein [Fibrobacter sp.]
MKSKIHYFLIVLFVISAQIFAQNDEEPFHPPQPNLFSAATADPAKTTTVNNVVDMVKQYELKKDVQKKYNPFSSDYELEFYKEKFDNWIYQQGTAHTIRASYSRSTGDEKYKITASILERIIVPGKKKALFNHLLNLKGNRSFYLNENFILNCGIGADMIFFSKDITQMMFNPDGKPVSPLAGNFSLYTVAEKFFNVNRLVGGLMVQQSVFNRSHSTDLGVAALWGMPLGSRVTLNLDASYRITLVTTQKVIEYDYNVSPAEVSFEGYKKFDYKQPGASTPHSLNLGGSGVIKISDLFALNLGYRTILLAENYSSHTITVGGRFAF